jgi:hypothetical protein
VGIELSVVVEENEPYCDTLLGPPTAWVPPRAFSLAPIPSLLVFVSPHPSGEGRGN